MTDFGEKDFYIGAIKGAIYKVNPNARIDYISNYISKFNVEEGAYTLLKSAVEYPAGTIFVVLVEPAGATAMAGVFSGKLPDLKNKETVVVLTGGNIDLNLLKEILESNDGAIQ